MPSTQKEPCKVCRQIRYFLIVAIPILVIIGTRPDVGVPSFPIEMAFTNLILLGFFLVLGWRIYIDYFKNKKK